jgi:hypothetical protein
MSLQLEQRRQELITRHKILESVPGSGFHDEDKFNGKWAAPQSQHRSGGPREGSIPLPRISEHAIAFYRERDVVFVGPDVPKVLGALNTWLEDHTPKNSVQIANLTGTDKKLLVEIPKLEPNVVDGIETLTVWRDIFNDVVEALYSRGIGLSGQPYDDPDAEEEKPDQEKKSAEEEEPAEEEEEEEEPVPAPAGPQQTDLPDEWYRR